ncbi:hypothetical protein DFS33DRAFT_784965 [Desarmillaria ectypa]|nr:hypothetical protein DFS33DRAFT_784965 [Desarmillaria ectypa]
MALSLPSAYFIALGLEILLNGMYTSLFLASMYLLLMKKTKTKVIMAMIVLNSIMWAVATSHMSVSFQQNYFAFLKQHAAESSNVFEDNASPTIYSQLSLESINIVIGDSIVIWRAWTLWSRKSWVIFTSATLLTGTAAAAVGLVRAFATAPPGVSVFDNGTLSSWAIAFIISTLITNVWATALVAYRTCKIIREITGEGLMDRFRRQNGVLAILIESGVFYSTTWFIAIIAFICGNNGVYIVIDMLSQLTAIYPTLIITLVCLQSTLEVAISTFEQTTQTNPEWVERNALRRRKRNGPNIATDTSMAYPMQPMKIGIHTTTHTSTSGQPDFESTAEELIVDGKPRSLSGDTVRILLGSR